MEVRVREGETFDQLLKRFKQGIERSGLLREYKRKQRFKPKSELRRDKERAAARRRRRSQRRRAA